jgi:hypothetical protein
MLFCNVDPTVAEVFRASKLDSLFEFIGDRAAAVRAIADGVSAGPGVRKGSPDDLSQPEQSPRAGRPGGGPLRRRSQRPESA